MRLIDADKIKWNRYEDIDGNYVYIVSKKDIDNQPTVYDEGKCKWKKRFNSSYIKNPHIGIYLYRRSEGVKYCCTCGRMIEIDDGEDY